MFLNVLLKPSALLTALLLKILFEVSSIVANSTFKLIALLIWSSILSANAKLALTWSAVSPFVSDLSFLWVCWSNPTFLSISNLSFPNFAKALLDASSDFWKEAMFSEILLIAFVDFKMVDFSAFWNLSCFNWSFITLLISSCSDLICLSVANLSFSIFNLSFSILRDAACFWFISESISFMSLAFFSLYLA